jgi:hypothetical protein
MSGIRELSEESVPDVELAMADELALNPSEIRFGGARGSDTVALEAICGSHPRLSVFVPFSLNDQPVEAAEAARRCATHIVELHLPKSRSSFLRRNNARGSTALSGVLRWLGSWRNVLHY